MLQFVATGQAAGRGHRAGSERRSSCTSVTKVAVVMVAQGLAGPKETPGGRGWGRAGWKGHGTGGDRLTSQEFQGAGLDVGLAELNKGSEGRGLPQRDRPVGRRICPRCTSGDQ